MMIMINANYNNVSLQLAKQYYVLRINVWTVFK